MAVLQVPKFLQIIISFKDTIALDLKEGLAALTGAKALGGGDLTHM